MKKLPDDFTLAMQARLGDAYPEFEQALQVAPPVSIRHNPAKRTHHLPETDMIPWASDAFYLPSRPSFTHDPAFQAGAYYVQEASSMMIEKAFSHCTFHRNAIHALDLCAAPGGKSTHLLSLLQGDSLLVSNEIIPNRNTILRDNLIRWGDKRVIVTQNDSASLCKLGSYFDLILVDAPCSGEGLFRKDPDAVDEWSAQAVHQCARRQSELLEHALQMLRPEGYLIYSTCTYETAENDEQVERLLSSGEWELIPLENDHGFVKSKHGLQAYPHLVKGEGFYISLLRKKKDASVYSGPRNLKTPKELSHLRGIAAPWLKDADDYYFLEKKLELYAIPKTYVADFFYLSQEQYVRMAGLHIGTIKGKDLVPSPQLAQSPEVSESVSRINCNTETALKYMRQESISIPDIENGWHLICWEGLGLGWIKAGAGRINNYFPKGRRILH